jgi:hypothetical protein
LIIHAQSCAYPNTSSCVNSLSHSLVKTTNVEVESDCGCSIRLTALGCGWCSQTHVVGLCKHTGGARRTCGREGTDPLPFHHLRVYHPKNSCHDSSFSRVLNLGCGPWRRCSNGVPGRRPRLEHGGGCAHLHWSRVWRPRPTWNSGGRHLLWNRLWQSWYDASPFHNQPLEAHTPCIQPHAYVRDANQPVLPRE